MTIHRENDHLRQEGTASAKNAGLHYVSDRTPGIGRVRHGKHFRYIRPNGRFVTTPEEIARINALVIPPAWADVWICPDPNGHIQATGRDARGRKQYKYHARWRETRDENKFGRMLSFGRALPKIRTAVNRQMREPGLSRKKVLAAVVRLLELSAVRVGNEEYATQNHSYGLTTLRSRHAKVNGNHLRLNFRGKSGKEQSIDIQHPALTKIVRKCQHLPGQMLFQFIEGDRIHHITSGDVNGYIAEITGEEFTAKDFRTWKGTLVAAAFLCRSQSSQSKTKCKQAVVDAIKHVAEHLGNTPAICKKCYIHPYVIDCFYNGSLTRHLQILNHNTKVSVNHLGWEEKALLSLLRKSAAA